MSLFSSVGHIVNNVIGDSASNALGKIGDAGHSVVTSKAFAVVSPYNAVFTATGRARVAKLYGPVLGIAGGFAGAGALGGIAGQALQAVGAPGQGQPTGDSGSGGGGGGYGYNPQAIGALPNTQLVVIGSIAVLSILLIVALRR